MWSNYRQWDTPERREQGLVIVLPGIDGLSWCNRSVVRGLADAGIPHALEIYDWTHGFLMALKNLRDTRRHEEQSQLLVQKVTDYQTHYPGRSVFLIGHSAGGAMVVLTTERLSQENRIDGGILLAPALSPVYDLRPALSRTRYGLWNFRAWGDVLFLGLLTTTRGTVDRRFMPSAGLSGFRQREPIDPSLPRLHDVPYRFSMLRQGHLAGHFGCVNRWFVRRWVAPIVQNPQGAMRDPHPGG